MKKHIIIILALLFGMASNAMADDHKGKEKRAPRKDLTERIVEELNLNDAEATRFTALYTQYTADIHAAYKKHAFIRPQRDENGKPQRLTDEQIKHNLEAQLDLAQATLDLRRKYYKEYLEFLTPRQIDKLSKIEKKQSQKVHNAFQKGPGKFQKGPGKGFDKEHKHLAR